ncbi:MAG: hypothetical protein AB1442_10125 [Nitrospirota bacterium]
MKYKYRTKTGAGFICERYECRFTDPEFCRKRAENDIDDICQLCTGIAAVPKTKSSNLEFSTRGMNKKRAA